MNSIQWLDRLLQHLRYGFRGLRREPVFALTALVTLALGTAATTTVFSIVDAELWRPLPYAEAERLLAIGSRDPKTNAADGITFAELQAWRQRATALENLTAFGGVGRRTAQLDAAESVLTAEVTNEYFTTLGRRALLGRVFSSSDVDTAVLTTRAWQRLFAGDAGVLGSTILLNDRSMTIIGVVASDDVMGFDADLYVAIDERQLTSGRFYTMIGRLAPGASAEVVVAQVQSAIDEHAANDPTRRQHRAVAQDLNSYYRTTNARTLYFFLGAAILVMLLTIANAAGLIVSRAVRRTPEFAVRSAIGGGTSTLAAQLTAESALIAVPGCAAGLVLTNAALGIVGQFVPDDFLYRGTEISIDATSVALTLAIALITTTGFALVPLAIIRRVGARAALGASRRSSETPLAMRFRRVLLAGQLALTLTLLAGAGLFAKSFLLLIHTPLGFDPTNAWSLRMSLSESRFATGDSIRQHVDSTLDKLTGVPGIRYAAVATSSPLRSGFLALAAPAPAVDLDAVGTRSIFRSIGPDYFSATGTPIVRGRDFTRDDRDGAPLVAIVNQLFVDRVLGGADPIGRSIAFEGRRTPAIGTGTATIVGVVANVKEVNLNEVGMPDLYLPFAQRPSPSVEFIVRGAGADPAMSTTLRAAVADPFVPITAMGTLQVRVDQATARERFFLIIVVVFSILAVLTAAIGMYGALAYAVTTRTREFGIRLALGASPRMLVHGTLSQAARLGTIGGVLGLVFTLVLARLIGDALYLVPGKHNGLLYNTTTTDPWAMAGALAGVLVLSLIAAAVPARRASAVNPVEALRAE